MLISSIRAAYQKKKGKKNTFSFLLNNWQVSEFAEIGKKVLRWTPSEPVHLIVCYRVQRGGEGEEGGGGTLLSGLNMDVQSNRIWFSGVFVLHAGLKKKYNLNLPFGQASLKFQLPGQDFINCYFSLVDEQLVHILAHWASEWGKSLVRHKNLLVPDNRTGLFSSPGMGYRFHHFLS